MIFEGDCREVMRTLDANSVDAIITDPPYELGFMGKGWDRTGIAYDVAVWTEALRVLKPGGHLLAFGGSRTYHRLACAIEDAGFGIRDQIFWCYGSGFPKSHNVNKTLGEQDAICRCASGYDNLPGLRESSDSACGMAQESEDTNMLTPMQRRTARAGVGKARAQGRSSGQAAQSAQGPSKPGLEGWRDLSEATRQLRTGPICEVSATSAFNGEDGWLRDGASSSDGREDQTSAFADRGRPSSRSCAAQQSAGQSGTLAGQPQPQARGAWQNCPRCGKPIVPNGLGTALKPAHEPIVLARKPLAAGTVASNVLEFGTGALNVDGCRVGFASAADETESKGKNQHGDFGNGQRGNRIYGADNNDRTNYSAQGRWPANLIHDGSDEVEASFAAQSKETISRGGQASKPQGYGEFGGGSRQIEKRDPGYGDTGTASRFFYCTKASRQERWKHIVCSCLSQVISPDSPVYDLKHCPLCGDTFKVTAHPTQKPESLMRYLCRLITPPGGTVFDPFTGSGSTGRGAVLEGFNFIGCELSPEYADIARHRIKAAMNCAVNSTSDPDQLTLWSEGARHD